MVLKITINVLRTAGLLALILGIIRWFGALPGGLVMIHMLLGIIVTLCLWILGVLAIVNKSSMPMGIVALVWGALLVYIGLNQQAWLVGSSHWIIQVLHLLIGLLALGIGEAVNGITRRATATIETTVKV